MTEKTTTVAPFSNPGMVSTYADRTAKLVPGLYDMHRMVGILLAERTPAHARVLVLGAGGGLELKALALMQPDWCFDGVDPSPEMLDLARTTLGDLISRVNLHQGYIDDAPTEFFDAAVCLLTLHFLSKDVRKQTLEEIVRRLRPGAAFVVAHHSFPNQDPDKERWLKLNAAYAASSGVPELKTEQRIKSMKEGLPVLSPTEEEALLREAGFINVTLFYAALTFKGWVCYKPGHAEEVACE